MVKIAFAGGSGNVAQEIIDVLIADKQHDILILTRKDVPAAQATSTQGVTWVKAEYADLDQLTQILQGVHTVLSFIGPEDGSTDMTQKTLIDAAVQAGVKRFAPSEWATSSVDHLGWYAYKVDTRRYLEELNKDKKVLEYTLFQPGLFVNYFTRPYQSSNHIHQMEMPFDFSKRRAIMLDGGDDDRITLTTVQDLARVVARAIDFEGEWPVVGGIRGTDISIGQLIALGEKVRGGTPFNIEKVKTHDIETGAWKTSWVPKLDHPSIPPEEVDVRSQIILVSLLLAVHAGAYKISDEWNRLLPDYKFTQAEEFLTEAWNGKP